MFFPFMVQLHYSFHTHEPTVPNVEYDNQHGAPYTIQDTPTFSEILEIAILRRIGVVEQVVEPLQSYLDVLNLRRYFTGAFVSEPGKEAKSKKPTEQTESYIPHSRTAITRINARLTYMHRLAYARTHALLSRVNVFNSR